MDDDRIIESGQRSELKAGAPPRRVAIIHDWLVTNAGSEQVLDQLLALWPQADLFSLVCAMPGEPPRHFRGKQVRTSFIQRLPFGVRRYRAWLPLFPLAIEQFDLAGYDLIISSSHCVAKGVLVGPDQCHVCYCYSPMRYAWDLQHQYLRESGLSGMRGWPARVILHYLRLWDVRTAHGVSAFTTVSGYIARRIRSAYGRTSTVVYPGVDIAAFPLAEGRRQGFVTASRMVPYKRLPLIVAAFAGMPDLTLTVIGDGPDMPACRRAAAGAAHIRLLGYQQRAVLCAEVSKAQAFVFAAEEDFGLAPLEAQATGTPVIAFAKGGARETVRATNMADCSGAFFHEQTVAAIQAAVRRFLAGPAPSPQACRHNAERFSIAAFRVGMSQAVDRAWAEHCARQDVNAMCASGTGP